MLAAYINLLMPKLCIEQLLWARPCSQLTEIQKQM